MLFKKSKFYFKFYFIHSIISLIFNEKINIFVFEIKIRKIKILKWLRSSYLNIY